MPVVDGRWEIPDAALPRAQMFPAEVMFKGRGGKDLIKADVIRKYTDESPIFQLSVAKGIAMDIEQQAVEVSGAAEAALKTLKESLDKFKSTLANDLTSIKAAASRVQNETLQMKQSYQAAQAILTTPEFERAMANAERMAVALKAISELSETKLSVAVFSGGPSKDSPGAPTTA